MTGKRALLAATALALAVHGTAQYLGNATRVCRMGPPLGYPTDGRKNCLVVGDSISIGWTPYVASLLSDVCQVQHAPYSGDGGALDSRYQLSCLQLFLRTSEQASTHYDLILWNTGIHDVNYSGQYPEEYVPLPTYETNVKTLKGVFQSTGAALMWATTTPVPFSVPANDLVIQYNAAAVAIMQQSAAPFTVPIVDLYSRVIAVCGVPPYTQCNISNTSPTDPSPHYTAAGYQYLAAPLAATARSVLASLPAARPRPVFDTVSLASPAPVPCGAKNGSCPAGWMCTSNSWSYTGSGCCVLGAGSVDCGDNWHCCPAGTKCAENCSLMGCSCV